MLKDRVFWNIPEGIYTDGKNWYDSQQICFLIMNDGQIFGFSSSLKKRVTPVFKLPFLYRIKLLYYKIFYANSLRNRRS